MKLYFFVGSSFSAQGGVENHVFNVMQQLEKYELYLVCNMENQDEINAKFSGMCKVIPVNYSNSLNGIVSRLKILRNIREFDIMHFHDYSAYLKFGIYHVHKRAQHFITFHGWEGIYPPNRKIKFIRSLVARLVPNSIAVGHFIEKWYGTCSQKVIYGGVAESEQDTLQISCDIAFIGRLDDDCGFKSFLNYLSQHADLQEVVIFGGKKADLTPLNRAAYEDFINKDTRVLKFKGWVSNPISKTRSQSRIFTSGYLGILESLHKSRYTISSYENDLKQDYLTLSPFKEFIDIVDIEGNSVSARSREIADFPKQNYTWSVVSKSYIELWDQAQIKRHSRPL